MRLDKVPPFPRSDLGGKDLTEAELEPDFRRRVTKILRVEVFGQGRNVFDVFDQVDQFRVGQKIFQHVHPDLLKKNRSSKIATRKVLTRKVLLLECPNEKSPTVGKS